VDGSECKGRDRSNLFKIGGGVSLVVITHLYTHITTASSKFNSFLCR
jgi:hypothetical protein